jgi:hypothetical protein
LVVEQYYYNSITTISNRASDAKGGDAAKYDTVAINHLPPAYSRKSTSSDEKVNYSIKYLTWFCKTFIRTDTVHL